LKRGVTRGEFEKKIQSGAVAECFHRVPVKAGDTMFLPSGRVHAIGSGLVIFEIQQNSDTTYRVFDWNRVGLDGKPRDLHVAESLASIDFEDFEPAAVATEFEGEKELKWRELVNHPLFDIEEIHAGAGSEVEITPGKPRIVAAVKGKVTVKGNSVEAVLSPGEFCLVPADLKAGIRAEGESVVLMAMAN
jgi:mannose-6-phosphate isomerase